MKILLKKLKVLLDLFKKRNSLINEKINLIIRKGGKIMNDISLEMVKILDFVYILADGEGR